MVINLGHRPQIGDRAYHVDPRHVGTVERIEHEHAVLRYDDTGWIGTYPIRRVTLVYATVLENRS